MRAEQVAAGQGALAAPILVTGATGFVGGVVLRHLRETGVEGKAIRLLVRDPHRATRPALQNCETIRGDLSDRDALRRAAQGVGTVLHVAGAVIGRRSALMATNAAGTRQLIDAVRDVAQPQVRFVLVSSLAAAGPSVDGAVSTIPAQECRPPSAYGQSKQMGELALHAGGLPNWMILRPPIVYGAGDSATRLLFRGGMGPISIVPWTPRPLSIVHVDDLARALLAAAAVPDHGSTLAIEGAERVTTDSLNRCLASACGRRTRLLRVPPAMLWPAAAAADVVSWLRGKPSFLSRDKLRELRQVGWVADAAGARRVLHWTPRVALEDGLREVARVEGFRVGAR